MCRSYKSTQLQTGRCFGHGRYYPFWAIRRIHSCCRIAQPAQNAFLCHPRQPRRPGFAAFNSSGQKPDRDPTPLIVVFAGVLKIQSAFFQGLVALGGSIADLHHATVTPRPCGANRGAFREAVPRGSCCRAVQEGTATASFGGRGLC